MDLTENVFFFFGKACCFLAVVREGIGTLADFLHIVFFSVADPDPLVRDTDPGPDPSIKKQKL
jgi:hypothetical protein